MTLIRTPAVAGQFYSGSAGELGAAVATPLGGLLVAAKRRGMKVTTLDMRNSADTTGDRSLVVGYGAWMFI